MSTWLTVFLDIAMFDEHIIFSGLSSLVDYVTHDMGGCN